jgi:hypothetical protein
MKKKIVKFLISNWLTILLAFIPPIIIWYYTQREKKALIVSLQNNVPIVSINKDYLGDIKVYYQGKEVRSLRYLDFCIENNGNIPIGKEDFENPLKFTFQAHEITTPAITSINPKSLNPKLLKDSLTSIVLQPLLLNPTDKFNFNTILMDELNQIPQYEIITRIKGVKDIELSDVTQKANIDYTEILISIVGILISAISFYYLFKRLRFITFELPGVSAGIKLGFKEEDVSSQKVSHLANKLSIDKYDTKANIMFLRIKLENLLAEIVRRFDYDAPASYSITKLSKLLYDKGHLDKNKFSSILNLAHIMNQEMHSIESYLSLDETNQIQDAALTTIAYLEDLIRTPKLK